MLAKKISSLVGEISELLDHEFDDLQGWISILEWPVGESRMINGTLNTKVYQDTRTAKFVTKMPPLTEFPEHWHDCTETCSVICGTLVDKKSKQKWEIGARPVFPKGERHIPCNPSDKYDTWLEVVFNR